jgi:hypothetical protein
MTRLPRRAALLLTLSLLTSAATAHAECAWVLWGQESKSLLWLPYRDGRHARRVMRHANVQPSL